ncbi:MAG: hypothetical protein U0836_13110 [Pirellulales bacterium]
MKRPIVLLWALAMLAIAGTVASTYGTYRAYVSGAKSAYDPLFWLGAVVFASAAWSMICIGRREGLIPKPDAKRDRSGDSN